MASSACWTCRARKKKCSGPSIESPTICTVCSKLCITCHGFGAAIKPSWLDGTTLADRRERMQRMEEIRRGVKITTDSLRRSRALTGLSRPRRGWRGDGGNELVTRSKTPNNRSPFLFQKTSAHSSALTLSMSNNGVQPVDVVTLHPHLEAVLLMHFLDVILPLQFPLYRPSVADGGRGWILALLFQTRPLYDAALSLAALHRSATMQGELRKRGPDHGDAGYKQQVIEYRFEQQLYGRAIVGLRGKIEALSHMAPGEGLKNSIEVLACIVLLILLEISKGDMENWQKHLLAAPDFHVFLSTYCTEHHFLSESSISNHDTYTTTESGLCLSFVDHAAMEFFSGVIIWFDILGSASTGLRPQYADICAAALGNFDSKVQLQNLMGCENWAMIIIREIAVLEDWKKVMARDGVLSLRDLARRADNIEQRLDLEIGKLTEMLSQVSNLHGENKMHFSNSGSKNMVVKRITHVFACAAEVYLHVVVSGPNPNLPEIRGNVARALAALNALPDPQLVQNVVWPFCIAGCMAAPDQEEGFRDLAVKARINEQTIGSAWKTVEIMESCWVMRRSPEMDKKNCDWFTAMKKLGSHVLLI